MNKRKLAGRAPAIVVALLASVAAAAPAGAADGRSIEVGGGAGTVGSWFTGRPLSGGDFRVTIPAGPRGDIEALVAVSAPGGGETIGLYGVQFRQRLRSSPSVGTQPFMTYGGVGVFYRDRGASMILPPVFGTVGGGVEQRVAPRVALRVEAQSMVLLVLPVAVRVAAGVSIRVGHMAPAIESDRRR